MLLDVRDVHAHYGASHVLHGASLQVAAGEVLGLLGRNGMGKTTLVHTIAGFLRPRRGSVTIDGHPVTGVAAERVARRGVALVPQGHRVFRSLTVGEHLRVVRGRGGPEWSLDEVCDRFPILAERWDQVAGLLSGGEQQMLAVARALVSNAALVLMDEPSEGLDPDRVRIIAEVIGELRSRGSGVLVVEQKVDFVIGIADRVEVMERGRITYRTDAAGAHRDPSVLYAELGFG